MKRILRTKEIDEEFQDMLENMNPSCEKCGMTVVELTRIVRCECTFFKTYVSSVGVDIDVDTRQQCWNIGMNNICEE